MKTILILSLTLGFSANAGFNDLKLLSTKDSQQVSLAKITEGERYVVIISHGTDCSVFRRYSHFINQLSDELNGKSVKIIMVNSFLGATSEAIAKESKELDLKAPVFIDVNQKLAKHFGLTTLSEAALIDVVQEKILYRGAIDDRVNYYYSKSEAKKSYLKDAVQHALKGEPIDPERTRPFGCAIQFKN